MTQNEGRPANLFTPQSNATNPDTSPYIEFIRNGLGKAKTQRKIVIVGAGAAGLTAAYELMRAGYEVVVLEAQQRVGGRIQTLREPFTHGLYAEAGAMRIPEHHHLAFGYLTHLLGEPLDSLREEFETTNDIVYIDGERWPRDKVRDTRKELDDKWMDAIKCARTALADPSKKRKAIEEMDRYSILDFLLHLGFWSRNEVELYAMLNNVESLMCSTSILEQECDDAAFSAKKFYQIKGGMDRLPNAFLSKLASSLRFGARVKQLNWKIEANKIRVFYTVGSKDHVEEGDAVILAVPVPVLRQMWFVPELSAEKRRAIRQVHYDTATKIFLQFRERFWEEGEDRGGRIITDYPIRMAYFCWTGGEDRRGVLLASYTWGDDALRWSSLPESARINQALRSIAHLFPKKKVRALFEGGVSKCWHEDPFEGGAFALFQPGQRDLHPALVKPEGFIYFAGEHTTLNHAWIEGAIESGIRAAHALFERFEHENIVDLTQDCAG